GVARSKCAHRSLQGERNRFPQLRFLFIELLKLNLVLHTPRVTPPACKKRHHRAYLVGVGGNPRCRTDTLISPVPVKPQRWQPLRLRGLLIPMRRLNLLLGRFPFLPRPPSRIDAWLPLRLRKVNKP